MQTSCVKVRLKPDSVGRVREWAAELNSRSDEVLATLRDEGVVVESVFLDSDEQGDFLIYYVKATNMETASQVARHYTLPRDRRLPHAQFKQEVWESREQLELLIDFQNLG